MNDKRARAISGIRGLTAISGALLLLSFAFLLPAPAGAEIVVRLEATQERVPVYLEPDDRSPVLETLDRGAVIKLSSPLKFRSDWYYVLFISARSGRTLAGYVLDTSVRRLNSTLKVVDLTPAGAEIADPKGFDLTGTEIPRIEWGQTESGILRVEGRPLSRESSGDMEFLSYHRDVSGKRCLITYVLVGQKLASLRLHLLERYANKDRYVADYNQVREFLNAKMGEPRYNNVVWKDRAYAERGEKLGEAVTTGTLSLSSEWAYQGTGLRLSLSAENSEILFAVEINDLKSKNSASY